MATILYSVSLEAVRYDSVPTAIDSVWIANLDNGAIYRDTFAAAATIGTVQASMQTDLEALYPSDTVVYNQWPAEDLEGALFELDRKAATTYVDAGLALKAASTDVTAALALKADITDVDADLALKAAITYVDTGLALKADITDVDADLALKAAITYVDTGLAGKSNTGHSHVIGDVTGLQTALDAKASIPNFTSTEVAASYKYNGEQVYAQYTYGATPANNQDFAIMTAPSAPYGVKIVDVQGWVMLLANEFSAFDTASGLRFYSNNGATNNIHLVCSLSASGSKAYSATVFYTKNTE